jgi:hypothetical protein
MICLSVYLYPVQPCKNGHMFCRHCALEYDPLDLSTLQYQYQLPMKKTCPICNEPLLTHYRAAYVENVVGMLSNIICSNLKLYIFNTKS